MGKRAYGKQTTIYYLVAATFILCMGLAVMHSMFNKNIYEGFGNPSLADAPEIKKLYENTQTIGSNLKSAKEMLVSIIAKPPKEFKQADVNDFNTAKKAIEDKDYEKGLKLIVSVIDKLYEVDKKSKGDKTSSDDKTEDKKTEDAKSEDKKTSSDDDKKKK